MTHAMRQAKTSLLSALAMALIVGTAFVISAHILDGARTTDEHVACADAGATFAFAELDEEPEFLAETCWANLAPPRRPVEHAAARGNLVGPAQGHAPTLQRPPSSI